MSGEKPDLPGEQSLSGSFQMRASLMMAAAIVATASGALAQGGESVAQFYAAKQVRVIVSSEPGGGYDVYARALAKHMGRFIPGQPSLITQNMPGAGGITATNHLYNVAARDGTVLANIQRGVPFTAIMGQPGPRFEPARFNWIGSLNNEVGLMVVRADSGVRTLKEAQEKEVIIGGSGPNDTEVSPTVLNAIIGTRFKIISGYPSSSAIVLAIERNEVQGFSSSYSALLSRNPEWLKEKKVVLLVQNSLKKHPDLPDVPLANEFARTDEDRQVLEFMNARQVIGRPFLMPPEVPADRVAAMRAAFDQMVVDTEFVADMKAQRVELTPVGGLEVQGIIERVSKTPKNIIERLDKASGGNAMKN